MLERPLDEQLKHQRCHAYSIWITDVMQIPLKNEQLLEDVTKSLDKLAPPIGWLPENTDDQYIVSAFNNSWPTTISVEYQSGEREPILICPFCKADVPEPNERDVEQICPQCGMDWPII